MKKISVFIIAIIALVSCGPSKEEMEAQERSGGHLKTVDGYDIIKIDNCEYIRMSFSRGEILTHKGNCKNKAQH